MVKESIVKIVQIKKFYLKYSLVHFLYWQTLDAIDRINQSSCWIILNIWLWTWRISRLLIPINPTMEESQLIIAKKTPATNLGITGNPYIKQEKLASSQRLLCNAKQYKQSLWTHKSISCLFILVYDLIFPENTNWRGRLNTLGLLCKVACCVKR